jgi:hypothetical protein
VFLEAGGWDAWVALIQSAPAITGVLALIVVLWLLFPEIRKRLGNADIEVDILGTKVKLSEATANLGDSIADLQKQVAQLVSQRDDHLETQTPAADQVAPGIPEPARPEPAEPEPEEPEGGPRPNEKSPGALLWIDRNPGEHVIERTQLRRAGWVIHEYRSIDDAVKTFSALTSIEPRVIVVVLSPDIALSQALARLTQLPPATAFIYGADLAYVTSTMAKTGDVFVTASAVELLSALTETRCGRCRLLIPEPANVPFELRAACPNCGSRSRQYSRTLTANLTMSSDLSS